jgi:hypothetical protein
MCELKEGIEVLEGDKNPQEWVRAAEGEKQ